MHCKYCLYADDLVIYLSAHISQVENMVEKVNSDIANISQWAATNGLIINENKTQAIWIGSRGFMSHLRQFTNFPILVNGTVITPCDSLKVLRVTLDKTLSWRGQCNQTAKKSYAALSRLHRNQNRFPESVKMTLIKSLVFPYFDYCAGPFLDQSKELCTKLSRCKNAAVRFFTVTKIFEHITPD